MLSPKILFLTNGDAARVHADLVATVAFQNALQASLAQMATDLPTSAEPDAQRDSYSRIMGARQFISILTNLGTPEPPSIKPKNDNLKY